MTGAAQNGDGSHRRARILVTDDRAEMLQRIEHVLGELYECEFAASVGEAREQLRGGAFELALCDVNAAGEQALALVEEIVADSPETAVVLVTGEDDPLVADRASGLGIHGYLVEPLQPGQLLITVMNALRRRDLEISKAAHTRNLWEQFQTLIDMAPLPIYAKDLSHRYVVANAKAEEMAGFGHGELIGRTDEAFMGPASVSAARQGDDRILGGAPPFEADETIAMPDGERTFHTAKFPLVDDLTKITAVGGISLDTTFQRDAIRLRDELASAQREAIGELRLSREETVERLVKAIEHHDVTTGRHINRIGRVAAFLATLLGLDPDWVELLRIAAPMHDVGKIGTRPEILRKPGPLSPEERTEMELHTLIGHEILCESKSELLRLAASVALTHHERYDGTGYPNALAGEEIPVEGRITAVADVFDALLSDRHYRSAMPIGEAVALIEEGRATQFDPHIVDLLLGRVDEAISIRA
ncbi:MAG TPA: HD domain-containing phosphohydrolase [Solirubrobacterales bacterium]|nr:HD domain-containing phosphohydrolase [Solirubrobacterales bacterium]